MTRKPFLIFAMLVGTAVVAAITFVQSARFARIVKTVLAKNTPAEWGIQGDFSDFQVHFFPPGVSINQPKVVLQPDNVVNLPSGSAITAARIDLNFYPLQMLSGNVRVHEAVIVDGDVQLTLDPKKFEKKAKRQKGANLLLNWDELFKIQAESIVFENTRVALKWLKPAITGAFVAKRLRLSQSARQGLMGYELEVELENISADFPDSWRIPEEMEKLAASVRVNAEGVDFERVVLESGGIRAELHGLIQGDLFNPQKMNLDTELTLEGKLSKILQELRLEKQVADAEGLIKFNGKLKGDLSDFKRTLVATGELEGQKVQFKKWSADLVQAKGTWRAASLQQGGELRVEQGLIRADEKERLAPDQPGHGGVIKLGAFTVPFKFDRPIQVPVSLERVHVHWAVATEVDSLFPLDLRATGPVELNFAPKTDTEPWELRGTTHLKVPHLVLDNQQLGKVRRIKKVLDVSNISLDGQFKIDESGFYPDGLKVKLQETIFDSTGSVGKNGWNLKFNGNVALAELPTIAETPIHGNGKLLLTVRGPVDEVYIDFDMDIAEARYLNLNLGRVRGLLTYDDRRSRLLFQKMNVVQMETDLLANGQIDLEKNQIDLLFGFKDGRIQDLNEIFDRLSDGLWWFPRAVTGDARGSIRVSGGLQLSDLNVLGDFRGDLWEFYGERFKEVELQGGFRGGDYFVKRAVAKKNKGYVSAVISYGQKDGFNWDVKTERLSLKDLDRVARLDVPIRGRLGVLSSGRTEKGFVTSVTNFSLSNFIVRGIRLPPSELTVNSKNGLVNISGKANGGQARLVAAYDFTKKTKSRINLIAKKLDFSPILLLMNPRLIHDAEIIGILSAGLNLRFHSGNIELSSGNFSVDEFRLNKRGVRLNLIKPILEKIERGTFSVSGLGIQSEASKKIVMDLRSSGGKLSGGINGIANLGMVEFLVGAIEDVRGMMTVRSSISGTIKEPKLAGKGELREGLIKIRGFESPVEKMSGLVRLNQGVVTVEKLYGELASAPVSAEGTVELFPNRMPSVKLSARLNNNKIKIFPFEYAKIRGVLHVRGETLPYRIEGDLDIESALSREKILNQGKGQIRKSARYTPTSSLMEEGDRPTFSLNMTAQTSRRIFVKNDLFDAELRGAIRILNTIAAPRFLGQLNVIRGKMSFKGRDFDVRSGKMVFDNPAVINPKFDISAETEVSDHKVQIYAHGALKKWKIEFSSDPPKEESEIVSLLALGFTADELRRFNSDEAAAVQQGEAASLLLHASDFNRDVREKTGLDIQVEQSEDAQLGRSIFQPLSSENAGGGAAPKIVIKRRVGKRLDLSVGSTVGTGNTSQQEFNAEVRMTPNFSVIGVWENFEGTEAAEGQTSYGVDLKVQKRFK